MSTFTIDFPGSASEFTTNASSAINGPGGTFTGDTASGNFHIQTEIGSIEGTYQVLTPVSDKQTPVAITITKKPFIVSTNKIRSAISDFF